MRISDWSSDVCCSDLQEDGSGNLCLAVRKSWLDEAGGDPIALLRALGGALPHLGERLAHADWSQAVDAIGHVPYGWRTAESAPALFRLGDQAGVIPSLAGEGDRKSTRLNSSH